MSHSELYLFCNRLHTFLVLPARILIDKLPQLKQCMTADGFAKVAWGDYQYYGAEHQPWWLGAKALLLPTASVLSVRHLEYLKEGLETGETAYRIKSTRSVINSVAQFICEHFEINAQNQLKKVRQSPCGTQFYQSRGTYLLCNTCNHWTAYGLREAGLTIKPQLSFSSAQVQRCTVRNGHPSITL